MRRFFRFSIRDLFWLTLVAALGLGWWSSQRELEQKLADEQEQAIWRVRGYSADFSTGCPESVVKAATPPGSNAAPSK